MEEKTQIALRETIRELTTQHLDAGFMVAGQCLSAVGFVGGTLPDRPDLTELPMSDVADAGFATGMALVGKRPMYILRYQGFAWYASTIINYAAKSKALWKRPCPLLVRGIAMENSIGPVAGSSHHSLFTRMPGIKVYAPMTPGEWRAAYEEFMAGDDVIYLSEHRGAYDNSEELFRLRLPLIPKADVVLFPISITRFEAIKAAYDLIREFGSAVTLHHIFQLKPFSPAKDALYDLTNSRYGGIVLDDDYPSGVASDIAMQLHALTGARMRVLGLENRTAGFAQHLDNLPPDKERIKKFVLETIKGDCK